MHDLTRTAIAALMAAGASAASAADLRIGLQDDADILDPDQARTFVGRIVFNALCDKLVDIDPDLTIVPMLAESWSWSDDGTVLTMQIREGATFHDGSPVDAEAVVYNLTRSTTLPESRRKSELASMEKAEATGPQKVTITLRGPDATFMAQLTDRAGMIIAPAAAEAKGLDFGLEPVCSGPFRFVERVQQDRIVLEKFADYWNADAIDVERVTFLPIPDSTVRFANLRAGDLDMLERLAATDLAAARAASDIEVATAVSLGYQGITINVNNGARSETPLGKDARVRKALSLSIDREALNQVVFEGAFAAGNQPVPPTSPWYDDRFPVPARDVAAARALLDEAGVDRISFEMQVANNPVQLQVVQVIQAMAAEAGFDIEIVAKEFATMLSDQSAGDYDTTQVGWSGRTDPDGNIHTFQTCGGGINESKFCDPEVDRLLNEARAGATFEARKAAYDAARAILVEQNPIIYLYHPTWIWALNEKIEGFVPYPDGMIRLAGVSVAE
jgi:peptide/nickel transport system substrate-binding protein